MTRPLEPERLLRHRPPALLIGRVVSHSGHALVCTGMDGGDWSWSRLLEAAAQTAGLLAGLQRDGLDDTAVIAEYRDIEPLVRVHQGPIRIHATIDRRVMRFWRCRVTVYAADDRELLRGLVTIAPPS